MLGWGGVMAEHRGRASYGCSPPPRDEFGWGGEEVVRSDCGVIDGAGARS